MALGVAAARFLGAEGVLLASTRNAAVSAAAYAARADLPCRVYAAAASLDGPKVRTAAAYDHGAAAGLPVDALLPGHLALELEDGAALLRAAAEPFARLDPPPNILSPPRGGRR
jgi:hypothetical protein